MKRSKAAVLLFTLSPEAEGARKSLGLGGSRRSTRLFASLIEHVERVCAGVSGADLLVASDSPLGLEAAAGWLPQRGGDFGESLELAVEEAFALGYERVVVVGNDAPELSRAYLRNALDALSREPRKAVLGPASDGGYNLLGLTAPCAAVFRAMPWGSSEVARQTVERLRSAGFSVSQLPTLDDIDDASALVRFLGRRPVGLEWLIARLRRLTDPLFWAMEARNPWNERPTSAGAYRWRAPPAFSRTKL